MAPGCDGTATVCPADLVAPATTSCRPSAGACDAADTCEGSTKACPADLKVAAGTECRAAGGPCDLPETCDGTTNACPTNALAPATTVCRAATDLCDVQETCTGTSEACPADAVAPPTTECRPSAGSCDPAETCDGGSKACPTDLLASAGDAGSPTCAPFLCDGVNTTCATTCLLDTDCATGNYCNGGTCTAELAQGIACTADNQCGSGSCLDGVCCDAACGDNDTSDCQACTAALTGGTDGTCAPISAGTECRASAGSCDVAESCDGATPTCPEDVLEPAGTECRAATGDDSWSALPPSLRAVARLAAEGLADKEIAEVLGRPLSTVRTYMRRVFRRLGVHSRRELMARRPEAASPRRDAPP